MKIDNSKVQVVSFSGGRTSAYMVYLIEQMRKTGEWTAPTEYIFMDTGAGHPETYEFIKKCVEHFGIELTCLRSSIPKEHGQGPTYKIVSIDDVGQDLTMFLEFMAKYGNPTINRPVCTDKLKTVPSTKYLNEKHGRGNYVRWLGMRADEPNRLKEVDLLQMQLFESTRKRAYYYLAEISEFTKEDVLDFWEQMPFDLQIEEHLGNCVFCIKKGASKVALAQRDEPEMFDQWNAAINHESVRLMNADKFGIGHIYRNWLSPEQLIAQFSELTNEELRERIYKEKKFDTGSCSESCEGFVDSEDLVFDFEFKDFHEPKLPEFVECPVCHTKESYLKSQGYCCNSGCTRLFEEFIV
jgi:3'-phosphoadenosine 5'-phosphosulfate sulfotransferase (PAPS reductase)/FAD synthetase